MLLTCSEKGYFCSLCSYTTNRKFNLDRHTKMVHKPENPQPAQNVDPNPQFVERVPQLVERVPQFVERVPQFVERVPQFVNDVTNLENNFKCETCYRVFSRKDNMVRHTPYCRRLSSPLECDKCHQILGSRSALSHHRSKCDEKNYVVTIPEPAHNAGTLQTIENQHNIDTQNNTNIETQNNTVNNNCNNTINNNIIINFPDSMEDDNFKFIKDHMTVPQLEMLFNKKYKPKQGFARYTSSLLECPENRNVYKSSPNTKYARIFKDGRWVYELDEEVFPLLTYHMTIAALEDINNNKKELRKNGKINYADIAKCLDDINTENDENDNYSFALEKLKIAVMNFSDRFKLPHVV